MRGACVVRLGLGDGGGGQGGADRLLLELAGGGPGQGGREGDADGAFVVGQAAPDPADQGGFGWVGAGARDDDLMDGEGPR